MNEIKKYTKIVPIESIGYDVPKFTIGLVKTTTGHTYFGLYCDENSDWLILDKFSLCVYDYITDEKFDEKYSEIDRTEDLFTDSLLQVCIDIYNKFDLDEFNSSKIEIPSNCSDLDKDVFINTVSDDYRYNKFVEYLTKCYNSKIIKFDNSCNNKTIIKITDFYWNYDIEYVPYLYVSGTGITYTSTTDKNETSLTITNSKTMNYRLGDLLEIFLNKDSENDYIKQHIYEPGDSFMSDVIAEITSHYGNLVNEMKDNPLFKEEEQN